MSNINKFQGRSEQYFKIPTGEVIDPNILSLELYKIEVMNSLLVSAHTMGGREDDIEGIAFILEGLIYQAQELAYKGS